jgi:hypothetical protein
MAALLGRLGAALSTPLKRAVAVLTEVWLTALALAFLAGAAYTWNLTAGLAATGACLFILEWQIAPVLNAVRQVRRA